MKYKFINLRCKFLLISFTCFLTACGDFHAADVRTLQEEAEEQGKTLSELISEDEEGCEILLKESFDKTKEINATNLFEELESSTESTGGYIVCKYLEAGGDVNIKDAKGIPLIIHVSAIRGYIDATQLLIDRGVDVNAVDTESKNSLYYVAQREWVERISHNIDTIDTNINKPSVNFMKNNTIVNVILPGAVSIAIVSTAIEKKAIDDNVSKGLVSRRFFSRIEYLISMLIQAGAQTNLSDSVYGISTLHWVVLLDEKDELDLALKPLSQSEVNPNTKTVKGNTPLHVVLYTLLDKWDNTISGYTSILFPFNPGRHVDIVVEEIIKVLLIIPNIDVDAKNNIGQTPLMIATIDIGNIDIIIALLEADADPNVNIEGGETLIFIPIRRQERNVVTAFLEADADPNIRNDKGKTPLFVAVETGNIDIVRALLEADADPTIKAKGYLSSLTGGEGFFGDSPIDVANDLGFTEIENLLKEYRDIKINQQQPQDTAQ